MKMAGYDWMSIGLHAVIARIGMWKSYNRLSKAIIRDYCVRWSSCHFQREFSKNRLHNERYYR